jgi:hypothetical protein
MLRKDVEALRAGPLEPIEVALLDIAKFGGPDSLPIRPAGGTGSSNSIRSAK